VRNGAALFFSAGAAALLFRCGSLSFAPLAGGSGAGNPGGTVVTSANVVFSMSAVNGQGQPGGGEAPVAKLSSSTLLDSSGSITAADRGGLQFTLTEVSVSNVAARFMLDSEMEPERLLSHMADRPPELLSDSNAIVLSGSHEFDALSGRVDSSNRTLRLPVARYTGVRFDVPEYAGGCPDGPQNPSYSMITMRGTFLYGGTSHALVADISYSPMTCRLDFRFGGGLFTLSDVDTTHLELQFDAQRWFADVDFAAVLGNGSLRFDAAGALNLSNTSYSPCVSGIQSVIASDFFSSGKLVVY
jgi:hypothetical protein